jgi:uncharacterized protein
MKKILIVLSVIVLFVVNPGWAVKPIGYVNDFANLLSSEERNRLEQKLHSIDVETTFEIVIVTVPSLEGKDAETFSRDLGNKWKIGKKGKDNGVILLVAPKEKKWFFKSGYGAEAALPDSKLGSLGRNEFVPLYREKKVEKAFANLLDKMLVDIRKYNQPATAQPSAPVRTLPAKSKVLGFILVGVGLLGLALAIILGLRRKKRAIKEKEMEKLEKEVIGAAVLTPPFIAYRHEPSHHEEHRHEDHHGDSHEDHHEDSHEDHNRYSSDDSSSGGGGGFGGGGGSFGGGGAGGDL